MGFYCCGPRIFPCRYVYPKAIVFLTDVTESCEDTLSQTLWLELIDDSESSAPHLFPSQENLHKMSFAGESHQNSSPADCEELASSLCPTSPGKAWHVVDSSLLKNTMASGLDILWFYNVLKASYQSMLKYYKTPRMSEYLPCCSVPCRKENEDLCVYFQLHRRWKRLRYLPYFVHLGHSNAIRAELGKN